VDDVIATGGTVRAAIQSIRAQNPSLVILAVPVAAPQTLAELASEGDQVFCLMTPNNLRAIGNWYEDFSQVPDSQVVALPARAR